MLIDVSMPITPGSVFRKGTPPVQVDTQAFYHPSEGQFETTMICLPAHTATHVDLVFSDRCIAPEQMIGNGKLIDIDPFSGEEPQLADIQRQVQIDRGDYVFLRTGWSQFANSERYHDHPEIPLEIIEWLISQRICAVGIDALGLALGRKHGEYDRLLAQSSSFVIENLVNLDMIPGREFKVYCFPLSMTNVDAIPARVLVEVEDVNGT